MSGLAELLLSRGFRISGSDSHASELTEHLAAKGAQIYIGHDERHVAPGVQAGVFTAAVHEDNPEYREILRRGLPLLSRAELLGQLMRNYRSSYAVAGTHGKTTTTSMLSEIMLAAEGDPTISVGGMLDSIGGNLRIGASECFVTEACEYTNSYLEFYPHTSVILNIRPDHLDYFKTFENVRSSFRSFADNTAKDGCLVLSSRIEDWRELMQGLPCRIVTFGEEPDDDYRAEEISLRAGMYAEYVLYHGAERLGRIALSVPGHHNVGNSLAAAAAALENGIPFEAVRQGLVAYKGTHRRFEKKGILGEDIMVIDDYAHHPDEIEVTLKTARSAGRPIVCVFQSHTYSRTRQHFDDFVRVLSLADKVILAPIYPARETDTLGMSAQLMADALRGQGTDAIAFSTFEEIEDYVRKNVINGAMLITMGAGDVVKIGESLLKQ